MSAGFELLRFEASPVSATVAVVELDGRFSGPAPARVRLLVERGGHGVEVPAVTSGGAEPWTASFAVALADLADGATEFSLVPGRGPLIALPAPEVAGGPDEDRYIRLARQANELRHRLGEAVAAAAEVDDVRAELAVVRREAEEEAGRLRAEVEAAERRGEEEAGRLRASIAELEQRVEAAEASATTAREQRDAATAALEGEREQLAELRSKLRETEVQLTDTERDRAALRARAEAADRTVAELTQRVEQLEQQVRDAEAKTVAAEDETRVARRDLRDTRARLEALLRERRHHTGAERRGHEVPDAEASPEPGAGDGDGEDRTEVLETREITPPPAAAPAPDPEAPARAATATRSTRIVRISDAEAPAEPRIRRLPPETDDDEEPLDPARVGARYIEPSETQPTVLTPARIMVGVALLLLVAALVAILLGAGLV